MGSSDKPATPGRPQNFVREQEIFTRMMITKPMSRKVSTMELMIDSQWICNENTTPKLQLTQVEKCSTFLHFCCSLAQYSADHNTNWRENTTGQISDIQNVGIYLKRLWKEAVVTDALSPVRVVNPTNTTYAFQNRQQQY